MAAKMSAWCRGRTFRPDDDTAVTAVVLQAFRGYMGPHDPPLIRWAIEYATREVLDATKPYEVSR